MITVYEPWAKNVRHIDFNRAFLRTVSISYPERMIHYYGCSSQIDLLKNSSFKSIKFTPLVIVDYSKTNKILALWNEFKNLKQIAKHDSDLIFITNAWPHTIFFSRFLLRRKKVIFILHGQIESLIQKPNYRKIEAYYPIVFKLNLNQANFYYLVLGQNIYQNLCYRIPYLKKQLIWIDHPYIIKPVKENPKSKSTTYKLGTIGLGTAAKGTRQLLEVEKFIRETKIDNIELSHIGIVEFDFPNDSLIQYSNTKTYLSEVEYDNKVLGLDYILFFYPSNSYQLSASGALLEAIASQKRIIAIRNNYFEYIFNKIGDIGYLVNNLTEMFDIIKKIAANQDKEDDPQQINNLKSGITYFSPSYVASQLKNALSNKIILNKRI